MNTQITWTEQRQQEERMHSKFKGNHRKHWRSRLTNSLDTSRRRNLCLRRSQLKFTESLRNRIWKSNPPTSYLDPSIQKRLYSKDNSAVSTVELKHDLLERNWSFWLVPVPAHGWYCKEQIEIWPSDYRSWTRRRRKWHLQWGRDIRANRLDKGESEDSKGPGCSRQDIQQVHWNSQAFDVVSQPTRAIQYDPAEVSGDHYREHGQTTRQMQAACSLKESSVWHSLENSCVWKRCLLAEAGYWFIPWANAQSRSLAEDPNQSHRRVAPTFSRHSWWNCRASRPVQAVQQNGCDNFKRKSGAQCYGLQKERCTAIHRAGIRRHQETSPSSRHPNANHQSFMISMKNP